MLHVDCVDNIWLGYYGQNNSFVNVNGSANSFLKWDSDHPKIHPDISYVYLYYNEFLNEFSKTTTKSVFCQCRSGINCKNEWKVGYAHTSIFFREL